MITRIEYAAPAPRTPELSWEPLVRSPWIARYLRALDTAGPAAGAATASAYLEYVVADFDDFSRANLSDAAPRRVR